MLNNVKVGKFFVGLCIIFIGGISIDAPLKAQSKNMNTQEIFNQLISDLQKKPDNYDLRKKIIKFAQTMRPIPAIPSDAEKFSDHAEAAFKAAKSETGFVSAAKDYEKALLRAPWVANYYYNLGVIYKKAAKPQEAKRCFEFYLLADPNAQDADDIRTHIEKLENEISIDNKYEKNDKEKKRDELLLMNLQKSPAGAWAMSFFIGAFTPFLGSGQYYAGSYGSAVVTSLIGFASYGCILAGVIPEPNASSSKVKQKNQLIIAGAVIFSVTWLFDWIYAPVAAMNYNDDLKKKYMSSSEMIVPIISYTPHVANNIGHIDHAVMIGLSQHF